MTFAITDFTTTINALYDRLQSEPLNPCGSRSSREMQPLPERVKSKIIRACLSAARRSRSKTTSTSPECPPPRAVPLTLITPPTTATVVQRLQSAGALLIGKTNMDQFATGLVGTRSPHGACSSVFDERYISGGSSSGSAVAVAKNLVAFSLGTDTAGSGRVPAAFNGLMGLKPTRGVAQHATESFPRAARSTAFRSLRELAVRRMQSGEWPRLRSSRSVFARASSRRGCSPMAEPRIPLRRSSAAAIGVLRRRRSRATSTALQSRDCSRSAARRSRSIFPSFAQPPTCSTPDRGWPSVSPQSRASSAITAADVEPVVRGIIGGAERYTAVDAFEADYRLRDLRRDAEKQWAAHGRALAADDRNDLHPRANRCRSGEAEHQSWLLHEFREPAGSGCGCSSRRIPFERTAVRNFVHRPGIHR